MAVCDRFEMFYGISECCTEQQCLSFITHTPKYNLKIIQSDEDVETDAKYRRLLKMTADYY